LRLAGAGLLAATGAIHLDLYLTGYRSIPTLGWLFLMQVIAAFGLAAAVLATGSRLAAAAGAGFALATLGGYLLSVWIGLFGVKEIRTTAGIVAGVIEVAAFAALAALAAVPAAESRPAGQATGDGRLVARLQAGIPGAGRVVAGMTAAALVVLGVSVAAAGGPAPAPAGGTLTTARIGPGPHRRDRTRRHRRISHPRRAAARPGRLRLGGVRRPLSTRYLADPDPTSSQ
jgi:hypothetical protein